MGPDAIKELHRAICTGISGPMERHLWLNLSGIKEKDKTFFLDALLSPAGLFVDAVTSVVERFQEVKKQAAAEVLPSPSLCLRGSFMSRAWLLAI